MESSEIERILRRAADEIVMPRFGQLRDNEVREKSPGDLVTVVDEASEHFIRGAILSGAPDAVVVGEEMVAAAPELARALEVGASVWLIDPLDGTGNFVSGRQEFGLMVCEMQAGRAVRSWILQPTTGDLYYAHVGGGAYLNGTELRSRTHSSRPSVSAWQPFQDLKVPGAITKPMFGSCAFDYPAIATGKRSFLIHNGAKPWDHLPGMLLLAELSGYSGHCDGTPFSATPTTTAVVVAAHRKSDWQDFADRVHRYQILHGIELESG